MAMDEQRRELARARSGSEDRRRADSAGVRLVMRGAALVVALGVGAIGIEPAAALSTRPGADRKPAAEAVPVAAVFEYNAGQDASQGVVHGAINAVVRVPDGTAVFYSLAGAGDTVSGVMPSVGLGTPYGPFSAWAVGVVDTEGLKYYMPLSSAQGSCLCSRVGDIAGNSGSTKPLVGWAVLPPLPKGLTHVTIQFGFGTLIPDVPVTSRLPKPSVASGWQNNGLATTPIRLGAGWPTLPPTAAIEAADATQSIRTLARNTANPDAATKDTADSSSIALNSSVLFDFDQSALTAQADAVLADVAATLTKDGAGAVSIVGYTDDIGDDAYNQTLSEARAQSVLAALSKLVTAPGITFTASGMGEQDPVADNSTDAGRQLNRRVTITFAKAGK